LQSRTPNSCNQILLQFFFFFFAVTETKPADFAMTHFSFLQPHTPQACNHFLNNQVALQAHRQSQVYIFATHITPGCNHARQIVAITHWFSSFFFFAVTEINQQILQ
jgi:hypothetical protein